MVVLEEIICGISFEFVEGHSPTDEQIDWLKEIIQSDMCETEELSEIY